MSKIELLKLLFSKNKAILIALTLSLLVHILSLNEFLFSLPELDVGQQAINVRLVNAKPLQRSHAASVNDTSQELAATSEPKQKAPTTNIPSTFTELTKTSEITPTDSMPKSESIQKNEDVIDEKKVNLNQVESFVTKPMDQTNEANKSDETANIAKLPVTQPFNYVETEFEIYKSNETNPTGKSRIVLTLDKNRTYVLSSITQINVSATMLNNTLVQKSEGVFTSSGLTPSYYSYQDGNDIKKWRSARFSWSDALLQMHSTEGDLTEKLTTSTHDYLSFMYQFMFTPPLENTEIAMTNGKNLRKYSYKLQGEEKIITKLGEINTLRLLNNDDEGQKIELWLGVDYQYIPVKIRNTEKDGRFMEQTVISIFTPLPKTP